MKTTLFTLLLSASVIAQGAQRTQGDVPSSVVPASIPVGTHVGQLPTTYDDGGRRDPFMSLVVPKLAASPTPGTTRPRPGLAGLALADVSVKGLIKSGGAMLAILEAPSKQSFIAHVQDRLLDASVQTIDDNGVVFTEQVGKGGPVNHIRKAIRPSAGEDR